MEPLDHRPSWDEYFMTLANEVATRTTCMRRAVGAVIVCAKMLINAGIDEIVYQNPYPDELAMSMLEEAGMKLRVFDL